MLKNKILYGGVLIVSAIMAILYNRYTMAVVFLILFFLPFILFLFLCCSYFFIELSMEMSEYTFTREDVLKIKVQIKNKGILPISRMKIVLEYENQFTNIKAQQQMFTSIKGKSEQIVQCSAYGDHCGNIRIYLKKIVLYDPMQLFSFSKKGKLEAQISILPKIHELETQIELQKSTILEDSDTFSETKSGDDPSEVFDIREYRQGDKLQRIHWKLSSKKEQWMVKEFSLPIGCSICILIDFYYKGKDLYTFMDTILEAALSYSFYFLENNLIHKIVWYDVERKDYHIELIKEEEDFYQVIESLLQAKTYAFEEIFLAMYKEIMEAENIPNLFCFGSKISNQKKETVKELGFQVVEVDEIE